VGERPATQGNNPIPNLVRALDHFRKQLLQGTLLGESELSFAGVAKYLRDRSTFTALHSLVQVFKAPAQAFRQSPAYGALTGSHESNQNYGSYRRFARVTLIGIVCQCVF
jgi:hypothetical protein